MNRRNFFFSFHHETFVNVSLITVKLELSKVQNYTREKTDQIEMQVCKTGLPWNMTQFNIFRFSVTMQESINFSLFHLLTLDVQQKSRFKFCHKVT